VVGASSGGDSSLSVVDPADPVDPDVVASPPGVSPLESAGTGAPASGCASVAGSGGRLDPDGVIDTVGTDTSTGRNT